MPTKSLLRRNSYCHFEMFNYSWHIETATRKSSAIYVYNLIGYQKNIYWRISVDSCCLLLVFVFLQDSKFESILYSPFLTSIWRTRGRSRNLATFKKFFTTKTASRLLMMKRSTLEIIGFLDLLLWALATHFPKIHRSVLRKIAIDLLYIWDICDVNLWEKNFGTVYSGRTNIFI